MPVLYIVEQGTILKKAGNRLLVEKKGEVLSWVHVFKLEQVVLMGNVLLTPQTIAFLLKEGIDTVFMSTTGKFRGRLISQMGKNVLLRRLQFEKLGDEEFALDVARRYVAGKLQNYRTLLRKHNQDLRNLEVERALHRIRNIQEKVPRAPSLEVARGYEGKSTEIYFGALRYLIRNEEFSFTRRTRRPPKDPVNVLLSFGYTLLLNTVQSAVSIVGLDPYMGSLHQMDYGRASLVLDLMEEFRPVIVDSLVLRVINRRVMKATDFYYDEGVDEEEDEPTDDPSARRVILTHEASKKWLMHFEKQLNQKVTYLRTAQSLTYRQICLEQARLLVRHMKGEENYNSYQMR